MPTPHDRARGTSSSSAASAAAAALAPPAPYSGTAAYEYEACDNQTTARSNGRQQCA